MLRPALLFCASCLSVTAATIHVNVKGDGQGDGSAAKPFRTIQQAAEQAQPGDTVLVAPGIYRERIAPPRGGKEGAPIIFRSSEKHGAVVRGSTPWRPTWQKVAPGIYSGLVDEALFPDSSHVDGGNPFRIPSSSTPYGREGQPEAERKYPNSDPKLSFNLGQVFVDDECYEQEPNAAAHAKRPKTWRYDNGTLSIHFPDDQPSRHAVEVTNQRRLFAPHKRQLGFITIEGFIFERCGNQYPSNFWEKEHAAWQHAGMVGTRSGRNWVIRNNILRFANSIGLDLGNEGNEAVDLEKGDNGKATGARGHLVEGNLIADNGAAGTASYNGAYLTIRGNIVERNNRLRFTGKKRWESAGIKLHNPNHAVIEGNLVRDNYVMWGIWCDQGGGQDTRIVGNTVIRQGVGIDFEIGPAKPCLVEGNILIENEVGVRTREAGGVTIARNLFVGSKQADVEFSLERKRTGNWSAERCAIQQNLMIGGNGLRLKLTAPDQFRCAGRQLDGNLYGGSAADQLFAFEKQTPMALADWQTKWRTFNDDAGSEQRSHMIAGCTYRFDSAKMELTVELNFDPKTLGETYPGLKKGTTVMKVGGGVDWLNR